MDYSKKFKDITIKKVKVVKSNSTEGKAELVLLDHN